MSADKDRYSWYLFAVAAGGFLLRLAYLRFLPSEGGSVFLFSQPDAFYHVRRTMLFAANFPSLDTFDYYLSYPGGSACPWPPLYDFGIALLSLAAAAGRTDIKIITALHALIPPLLACLAVIPLSRIVLMTWNNRKLALLSAVYLMLVPGLYGYSHIGSGDHHAAETFLSLWLFYWYLRMAREPADACGGRRLIAGAGLTLALGMTVWQGFALYYGVGLIFGLTILFIRRHDRSTAGVVAGRFAAAALVAAAVTVLTRVIFPIRMEEERFSLLFFSFSHPIIVSAAGAGLFLAARLLPANVKPSAWLKWGVAAAVAVLTTLVVCKGNLSTVPGFFLKQEPYMETLHEAKPLLQAFDIHLPDSFDLAENVMLLYRYTWLFWYILPFAYVFATIRAVVREDPSRSESSDRLLKTDYPLSRDGLLLFINVTLMLGSLTLLQRRWSNPYSPCMAIALGLFTLSLTGSMSALLKNKARSMKKVITAGFNAVLLCLFFLFCAGVLASGDRAYPIDAEQHETLVWMRTNTPRTSHLYEAGRKPEYAVVSSWDYGHLIMGIAERPVMANNFAYFMPGEGYRDSNRLWESPTEEALVEKFEKYGGRFFIVTAGDDLHIFESPASLYLEKASLFRNDLAARFALPGMRLVAYDGSSSVFGNALARFRLVYESRSFVSTPRFPVAGIKLRKIYEMVKGARVTGHSAPGSPITISAQFSSKLWPRPFTWQTRTTPDATGVFETRVPYATVGGNYSIVALTPFIVDNGTAKKTFNVSDRDVIEGNTITVNLSGK